MDLTENDKRILRKIDGLEDIAGFLNPESVLDLMRVAKKMDREIERLRDRGHEYLRELLDSKTEVERLRALLSMAAHHLENSEYVIPSEFGKKIRAELGDIDQQSTLTEK